MSTNSVKEQFLTWPDLSVTFFTHYNEAVAAAAEFARKQLLTKDSTNIYEKEKSEGEGDKRIKPLL